MGITTRKVGCGVLALGSQNKSKAPVSQLVNADDT